jgi:hypothetical protein
VGFRKGWAHRRGRDSLAYPVKEKVLGYIIRENGARRELLVFDHVDFPGAGTQVPADTVEPA